MTQNGEKIILGDGWWNNIVGNTQIWNKIIQDIEWKNKIIQGD